jgi:hypothetical protein
LRHKKEKQTTEKIGHLLWAFPNQHQHDLITKTLLATPSTSRIPGVAPSHDGHSAAAKPNRSDQQPTMIGTQNRKKKSGK